MQEAGFQNSPRHLESPQLFSCASRVRQEGATEKNPNQNLSAPQSAHQLTVAGLAAIGSHGLVRDLDLDRDRQPWHYRRVDLFSGDAVEPGMFAILGLQHSLVWPSSCLQDRGARDSYSAMKRLVAAKQNQRK